MVVQLIIRTKAFALRTRTHTTRDKQFLTNQVFPQTGQGMEISRIMHQGSHIRHTGIQIAGTNRMPHDFILLKNRFVILAISIQPMSVCSTSCFFYEILRHIKVFLITGDFIQFCQSHLDDRMTRRNVFLPFIRSEYLTNQIRILDGYIQ